MSYLAKYWNKNLVTSREDKTAWDTEGSIYLDGIDLNSDTYVNTYGNTFTNGSELLMGLLVADEGNPFPEAIKINDGSIINMNNAWISNKYAEVASISSGGTKLINMQNWKISSMRLEYDASGNTYWHFILAR
jgi:hypothetical protein